MTLPVAYKWIADEPGPRMLVEARRLYGIRETNGPGNTPAIMSWADELGPDVRRVYTADSIPWCGLFMAVVAQRAGKPLPASPLWARAWASWGSPSPTPALGDVLVFARDGGGHVGLYIGENDHYYFVLGGNQGDAVNIRAIAKHRMIAARRNYKVTPANVRPIRLGLAGEISHNEG